MSEHDCRTSADCDCVGTYREGHCNICDGGLSLCRVCGGLEGGLTTECPARQMTADEGDAVCAGRLDFREGQWTSGASVHCPAHHARRQAEAREDRRP